MMKTKRSMCLLIALVLVLVLIPTICFAGSWYTMPISGAGTKTTPTFQNSGQPTINITFSSSSSFRNYTIELQRQSPDGTWSTSDQTSGTINANQSKSVSYVSRITNTALNTYRYKITLSNGTSWSGSVLYYK